MQQKIGRYVAEIPPAVLVGCFAFLEHTVGGFHSGIDQLQVLAACQVRIEVRLLSSGT